MTTIADMIESVLLTRPKFDDTNLGNEGRPNRLWTKRGTPLIERLLLMSRVDEHGCWIWNAATNARGYGKLAINGKLTAAHRASYELFCEPIPDGLVIDHLCRVRRCINPFHMEVVTHAENLRRGESPAALLHGSTHCRYGHEYTAANTYTGSDGVRQCRECRKRASRKRRGNV